MKLVVFIAEVLRMLCTVLHVGSERSQGKTFSLVSVCGMSILFLINWFVLIYWTLLIFHQIQPCLCSYHAIETTWKVPNNLYFVKFRGLVFFFLI